MHEKQQKHAVAMPLLLCVGSAVMMQRAATECALICVDRLNNAELTISLDNAKCRAATCAKTYTTICKAMALTYVTLMRCRFNPR